MSRSGVRKRENGHREFHDPVSISDDAPLLGRKRERSWAAAAAHRAGAAATSDLKKFTPNDFLAGIINFLLMFSFCSVFSSIVFEAKGLIQFVPLGVGVFTVSAFVSGFAFSMFSDVPLSIAGPDINSAIFFAQMAQVADQQVSNPNDKLSTTLAMIMLSSALLGTLWMFLGYFKLTRVVQFMPSSVLNGFMAAIGYIVCVKAFKTAVGPNEYHDGPKTAKFWALLTPSLVLGIAMYAHKRWKLFSPLVFFPMVLLGPVALFYVVVYALGENIESAREFGWLFESFDSSPISEQFQFGYARLGKVDWHAVRLALPTMAIFLLVSSIDFLLKLAGTKKMLGTISLRYNHEVLLAGKTNLLLCLLVGAPGYSQLKFNVLTHGITSDTSSRNAGMLSAFINAIFFFTAFPLINYLPRFFLASLLVSIALDFLISNLIDNRHKMTLEEYLCVWIIFIVNAATSLVVAVLSGVMLALLIFAIQYGRGGVVRAVISGSDFQSSVVRSAQEDRKLERLGASCLVVELHRYIFFGSAAQVVELVRGIVLEQENLPTIHRVTVFVIDWTHVDGLDWTAAGVFLTMVRLLREVGSVEVMSSSSVVDPSDLTSARDSSSAQRKRRSEFLVLFTGMKLSIRTKLASEGVLSALHTKNAIEQIVQKGVSPFDSNAFIDVLDYAQRRCFDSLDLGMEFVEERLLERASQIRQRWLVVDSFRRLHDHAKLKAQHEAFEHVLGGHLGDTIWRYVEPLLVPANYTLCRAGHVNPHLYLLQRGRLTAYLERSNGELIRLQSLRRGAFVNEDALFVEIPVSHTIVADVDSKVLAISRDNIKKLESESPAVAFEIHRNLLRHIARTRNKLARELDAVDHWTSQERNGKPISNNNPEGGDNAFFSLGAAVKQRIAEFSSAAGTATSSRSSRKNSVSSSQSSVVLNSAAGDIRLVSKKPVGTRAAYTHDDALKRTPLVVNKNLQADWAGGEDSGRMLARAMGGGGGIGMDGYDQSDEEAAVSSMSEQQQQQQGTTSSRLSTVRSVFGRPTLTLRRLLSGDSVGNNSGSGGAKEESSVKPSVVEDAAPKVQFLGKMAGSVATAQELSFRSDNRYFRHIRQSSTGEIEPQVSSSAESSPQFAPSSPRKSQRKSKFLGSRSRPVGILRGRSDSVSSQGSTSAAASQQQQPASILKQSSPALGGARKRGGAGLVPEFHLPPALSSPQRNNQARRSSSKKKVTKVRTRLSERMRLDAVACFGRATTTVYTSEDLFSQQQQQHEQQQQQQQHMRLGGSNELLLPRGALRTTLMDIGFFPTQVELDDVVRFVRSKGTKIVDHNKASPSFGPVSLKTVDEAATIIVQPENASAAAIQSLDVTEDEFVRIVKELSLAELSGAHVHNFATYFSKYATELFDELNSSEAEEQQQQQQQHSLEYVVENCTLGPEELGSLMVEIGHPEDPVALRRLVAEWSMSGSNRIDFPAFCSMLAHFMQIEQLDEQVEDDFSKIAAAAAATNSTNEKLVYAEDILTFFQERGYPLTYENAREMVWEADISAQNALGFNDLIDTLTTVFDAEISPHAASNLEDWGHHSQHASIAASEFKPIASLVERAAPGRGEFSPDSKPVALIADEDLIV